MKQTIAIPFEPGAADGSLTLELDDEKNAGVTTFAPGVDCFIKSRTAATIVLKGSTFGNLTIAQGGLQDDQAEELELANEAETSLRYDPAHIVSTAWLGRGLGNVTFAGKAARVAAAGYGILRVIYKSAFTRLRLSGVPEAAKVLVWARDANGRAGDLVVEYGEEGAVLKSVYRVTKSYCTDFAMAGASVWVDEIYKGITDAAGRLYVGQLLSGSRHTTRVVAAGYKDSDADALANDEFVVP